MTYEEMKAQLDLHGFVPWTLTIADAMEENMDWDRNDVIKALRGAQKRIDELTIKLKEKNGGSVEALPIAEIEMVSSTTKLLASIENMFGKSATELAKMLRVTRQTVYHYRQGMEPSVENKRRLKSLATLASECGNQANRPIKKELKSQLMEYLSDEDLDITALRRMLSEESALARGDVTRARHAEGKPVYIGDPDTPGKLIQIRPDGSRIRGWMINRQFVAVERAHGIGEKE